MIKLAISGSRGKMGQRIINVAQADKDFKIVTLLERKGHIDIGIKVNGAKVTDDIEEIKNSDVLVEFTTPEATMEHLKICLKYKKPMVIGTTGLSPEQKKDIESASKEIAIVLSPNMSLGVNLLFKLIEEAANKLSKDYRVGITEAHHAHKKDAPSGTAKKIADIIEEARKEQVKDIKSIREGEIVGDHEVVFESQFDTIKISHFAKTRDIFAKGALSAAKWVIHKKKGLFSTQDILR
ncbi:MAG: 4-hydroxy-tetrahydrodipicolinate reductase [Candidatus Omnitrophica bacterium]|nr:4-hydroxy-tetrahydrodipicolinate reductase [Candidatus Omnitrophota bacterium]MDD5352683.1 4-hydroxy-tetrahydrodipicolinate reductase [Candidatus Omnitrophota bacterium]MDD5550282.1 4-hydroxy-tetrahydrodipicolinate reductase [Candidatus Omnitrophota bacterium]